MNRSEKSVFISSFSSKIQKNSFVAAVNYSSFKFDSITKFRRDLISVDGKLLFVKNTLASLSFSDQMSDLKSHLTGPVCFVVSSDPILTSKILYKFVKDLGCLKVIGGFIDGQFCSEEDVRVLSELPTMEEARARIVGIINSIPSMIARVISLKN